jgi:hypothetical protein
LSLGDVTTRAATVVVVADPTVLDPVAVVPLVAIVVVVEFGSVLPTAEVEVVVVPTPTPMPTPVVVVVARVESVVEVFGLSLLQAPSHKPAATHAITVVRRVPMGKA